MMARTRYGWRTLTLVLTFLSMMPLIVAGAPDREADPEEPAIIQAVRQGKAAVAALLASNPDLGARNAKGLAAQHVAAAEGDLAVIDLLASHGADLEIRTRGEATPLLVAIATEHPDAARRLLELGAQADAVDRDGWSATHMAARRGQLDLVQALLARGAPVDAPTRDHALTPLHLAVMRGHADVAALLLEKGADPARADRAGFRPLHRAARAQNPALVRLLLDKGADPRAAIPELKVTPLHFAAASDAAELVDLLVKAGADVKAKDADQEGPLTWAVRDGSPRVVQRLLEAGAPPDSPNVHGLTPLHYAALRGSREILDLLLEKGARLEAKALQWISATPLHLAIEAGHKEIVARLLDKGAEINAPIRNKQDRSEEWTPLFLAEVQGDPEIIDLLRRRGQARHPLGTGTVALYQLTVERIGPFPGPTFPPTLRRRLEQVLGQYAPLFSGSTLIGGKFCRRAGALQDVTDLQPVPQSDWTSEQRAAAADLDRQTADLRRGFAQSLPAPASGLVVEGFGDLKSFYELLEQVTQHPLAMLRAGTRQAARQREQMAFLAGLFSVAGVRAVLDATGLHARLAMMAGPRFPEVLEAGAPPSPERPRSLTYLDPQALMAVSLPQGREQPKELMPSREDSPGWRMFEKYLQDVGLDFARDLLPCLAGDLTFTLDLEPIGEQLLPDLRLIVCLRDPAGLERHGPALRQLAQNLGIFVASSTEDPEAWKLSYFLRPDLPVHGKRLGRLFLLANGAEGLRRLAERIRQVDTGAVPPFTAPDAVNTVFRLHLGRVNAAVQRFAQSPAGRGLPPLPNFPTLEELGTLQIFGTAQADRILVEVELPIASGSGQR
ncbi:MAG: hypothetical protein OZSIB_4022 [Candidatus Ozemobacter sibiricus]|jgi:ankyrin repeat protein|uniref:Uncharacterized protein n=1 Tax=Candidatus Ozemobacter sibiricus TaxID=2268124 RepID=A0A367ZP18_9BACT|nr:MAG: hypothetical protein OZSIB_4022 [Candidatus Ozemobacter sibiricus]